MRGPKLAALGHLGAAIAVQIWAAILIGIVGGGLAFELYLGRTTLGQLDVSDAMPLFAFVPLALLLRRSGANALAWRLAVAYVFATIAFVLLRGGPLVSDRLNLPAMCIALGLARWLRPRSERGALVVLVLVESFCVYWEAESYAARGLCRCGSCASGHPSTLAGGTMLAIALGVSLIALGRRTSVPGFGEEPRVLSDGAAAPSVGQLSIASSGRLSDGRSPPR